MRSERVHARSVSRLARDAASGESGELARLASDSTGGLGYPNSNSTWPLASAIDRTARWPGASTSSTAHAAGAPASASDNCARMTPTPPGAVRVGELNSGTQAVADAGELTGDRPDTSTQ